MTIKKETLLLLLLAVFIISYNTVLLEPYRYINYITKILIILFLFLLFKHKKISGGAKLVVFLYSIILAYGFLAAILNQQTFYSFSESMLKYALRIVAFAAIIMILATEKYSDKVIKLPMWIGVILSIQSIILFVLLFTGYLTHPIYAAFPARGGMPNYGILGFAPSVTSVGNHLILRASSFFSEASNFAVFLEYSILVAFGYYVLSGRKRYLFLLIPCLLAFILTSSLTGFLSLFLAISLFIFLKKKNVFIKFLIPIVVIILIFSFHSYLKTSYIPDPTQRNIVQHVLLSKYADALRTTEDIRSIYGGRVYSAIESFKIFLQHPLGVGLIDTQNIDLLKKYGEEAYTSIHLYGAFLFWLIKTGFIGIFFFILIFYLIIKKIKTFLLDKTDIRYYLSVAFITISIHHLITGDWIDPMFLFVIALLLSYRPLGRIKQSN